MSATHRAVARDRLELDSGWSLGQSAIDGLDAANECRHGSLPTDRKVTCGCWNTVRRIPIPTYPPPPPRGTIEVGGRWENNPARREPSASPKLDSRGRDASVPRGLPARIDEAVVRAAHRLHMEGMSLRELGKRNWRRWGYATPKGAAQALSEQFKAFGLDARPRIEMAALKSTVHGKATRTKRAEKDPEWREHRNAMRRSEEYHAKRNAKRRATGETRGVRCAGIVANTDGKQCQRFALHGSEFCFQHDPEKREQVAAQMARMRERYEAGRT